ncbi:MAG: vanadium-dependent haloperoxidase [Bacteroidota bacterium]
MNRWTVSLRLLWLLAIITFISSCNDESTTNRLAENQLVKNSNSKLIYDWLELYLEIEKDLANFRPNPTSRAIGYIGIAAYEAALPGMADYLSVENILAEYRTPLPNPYNDAYWAGIITDQVFWEVVLNHTYYRTFNYFLLHMSPAQIEQIESFYQNKMDALRSQISERRMNEAIARAETVSSAVIAYAQSDREGRDQVLEVEPLDYVPPKGEGLWQPTTPDFKNACHPYWRRVRTFVAPVDGVPLIEHAAYSEDPSSQFYQEAKEVYDRVANLTDEDRWIAEFWSDDLVGVTFSPPARQIAIANQLIQIYETDLETSLRFYLRLGLALNDASVICWGAKYVYNLERPVDYIRRLIDPNFNPIMGDAVGITGQNPNFPAYPSGHSAFAGAGASVFEQFFPNLIEFTDRCHEDETSFRGEPRTFATFRIMAEENAYSRIPLGVHFRMDCDEGLRIGYEVGNLITDFSLER